MTVTYLMDTARQAGLQASMFPIDEIGWDGCTFVGPEDRPLSAVFKLYPWEWMIHEEFGQYLSMAGTVWIEPPWKMLLSNKGILPLLWEMYPKHPNLLEASLEGPDKMESWVRKPLLGREGANILLHRPGAEISTEGEYGEEGFVYQALAPTRSFDGKHTVIGSWVIGHEDGNAAGIGVRESDTPIVTNTSQFVPHVFD
jgi:glutathionylspermidine synthase